MIGTALPPTDVKDMSPSSFASQAGETVLNPSLHMSFSDKSTYFMSSCVTAIPRDTRGSRMCKSCMLHEFTACLS
jgi:hypothetical protein